MKNIRLFLFIIPLLAGLYFTNPLSIHAEDIIFKYTHNATTFNHTNGYKVPSDGRFAVLITDTYFTILSNAAYNYIRFSPSSYTCYPRTLDGHDCYALDEPFLYSKNYTLLETNLICFNSWDNILHYLDTGEVIGETDINGNPLTINKYVPVKNIRFLRYENTGSQFFLQKEGYAISEEPNIQYQFAGNLRYKYFPRSVLQDIITHYGWTDEQSIYDYFIENNQIIYETDYNYFMQQILIPNRVYDLEHYMFGSSAADISGYAFSGYRINNGNILQYIYSDYNDMSDLEVTLATFTMYPISWQNAILPFDTINFEWNISDILNVTGGGSTITQPDWQIPEPEDGSGITNIEYTHSNDDYMGRTSDILNAYYYDLPLNMISESTGFLTYVFEAIPKPIKIIYAFIIIVGCVVGVVCIARE